MPYPKPTLQRTLKRLPIYFLLIFALQFFFTKTKGDVSTVDRVLVAATLAAVVTVIFAPFMHMMDRFAYNRYQKRVANSGK